MPTDLTYTANRSRFVYGTGGDITTLDMLLPSRAWQLRHDTVGGRRIAAGGQGASHVVRRDEIIVLTLRFRENEWAAILALLAWGQGEDTFTWTPDLLTPSSTFLVWLHAPATGDPISPIRSGEYPKVFELTIELRRADLQGVSFGIDYYGNL